MKSYLELTFLRGKKTPFYLYKMSDPQLMVNEISEVANIYKSI